FVPQPAGLLAREGVPPIADDPLAYELRHARRSRARPTPLIPAHALKAAFRADRGDSRGVGRRGRCRLAEKLCELADYGLRVALHPLVRDEEHVRRIPSPVPRCQVI